jgi:mono/diheme cytochrome c family protein
MSLSKTTVAALLILVAPVVAMAQGAQLGEREYNNSCAQCHGPAGKGDGVMVGFLSSRAPDLTLMQKNNAGVFPVASLYSIIEGSTTPGVHGTSDMPAWGDRYNAKAPFQLGEMYSPADQEAFVRGRILALIEYISTLQQE